MNRPRWSKVFHDLWDHKGRTLLVMLTIAVGVFAVGFVGNMFFLMLPDLDNNYQVANPHAAILVVSAVPFEKTRDTFLGEGALGYIVKPFNKYSLDQVRMRLSRVFPELAGR